MVTGTLGNSGLITNNLSFHSGLMDLLFILVSNILNPLIFQFLFKKYEERTNERFFRVFFFSRCDHIEPKLLEN